ncbi:MAG: phenylalanine--tRNA ligase subunit beta [Candidatus Omnitrophica bacterium]|nr:phenylalanine--tRNA ligase subunit beta [Candidatus Omnitrophota bacterium]
MKFTYNWLKDFVEIKITPEELAHKLTMAGLEVTSLKAESGDFVFEAEVTSNRPDWLSIIGIAHEVAALTGRRLKKQQPQGLKAAKSGQKPVSIRIEDKKDCPLYTAKIIREAMVGPSPDWLRKRLELIGCRSINNVVDITNYILFTYGEPLHAFDLDKIVLQFYSSKALQLGKESRGPLEILVRRAEEKEEIVTIDGVKRVLDKDILLIASRTKEPKNQRTIEQSMPVAIAGVMGGKDTEVTAATKNILLEAAIFNPVTVRRSRQRSGLSTDSSYRFERGVDTDTVLAASSAAAGLILKLCGGKLALARSAGMSLQKKRGIDLDTCRLNGALGAKIPSLKIRKILESLGFKVKAKGKDSFSVTVPSQRQDVLSEIDLVEEVARIYGFENIPTSDPALAAQLKDNRTRDLVAQVRETLAGLGLNEAITYSLVDRESLAGFSGETTLEILNPLSQDQEVLRPTLALSLAKAISFNLNQKQEYVNLFEVANLFLSASGKPREELYLGIALCGTRELFLEQGLVREEAGLLHLKGIIETLFCRLGVKGHSFKAGRGPAALDIYVGDKHIGRMLKLPADLKARLDIKNKEAFLLEISLERLFGFAPTEKRLTPLPKYPGITRDISFILKEDIAVEEVLGAVRDQAKPLLAQVRIADYYKGKQIPGGFRGLTLSCIYRSPERTLTEAEVAPLQAAISALLTERFGARIR